MEKLFIGISSCWKFEDNGWNNALRDTWIQDVKRLGIDYRFFHGTGQEGRDDIVSVDCSDGYEGITHKAIEKYKWCLNKGYEYVFHCYHDTFSSVDRLLKETYTQDDYIGDFYHEDHRQPWPHVSYGHHCQGGPGYLISKKAMSIVTLTLPNIPLFSVGGGSVPINYKSSVDEDFWVGESLLNRNIKTRDHKGFINMLEESEHGPRQNNTIVTAHLSTIYPGGTWNGLGREAEWKYRPEYMYRLHREWQTPCA